MGRLGKDSGLFLTIFLSQAVTALRGPRGRFPARKRHLTQSSVETLEELQARVPPPPTPDPSIPGMSLHWQLDAYLGVWVLLSRMTMPEPGVAPGKMLTLWFSLCLVHMPTEGQRNLQPSPTPLAKSCLCCPHICPHMKE